MVITLAYNEYNKNELLVDEIKISDSNFKKDSHQERMPYLIPSGKTIKGEEEDEICITGYLKDN